MGAGLLIAGWLLAATPTPGQVGGTPAAPGLVAQFGTRFAVGPQPIGTMINQNRNCLVVAPTNWIIYGERREGDALDIAAADGRAAASYLVSGVAGWMAASSPNIATPENNLHAQLSSRGRSQVKYGQPIHDEVFGYTWLPFEIATPGDPMEPAKGVVLYRAWPVPGDPRGYVLVVRRAQTAKSIWSTHGAQAIAVALSIRCTVQLRAGGGEGGSGSADDRLESTYNQQLGMEYAHDPQTGENYWVSPSADFRNDGPEGPGYYKRSGNDLRRLAPGRSE
jgi:hypothetical protein